MRVKESAKNMYIPTLECSQFQWDSMELCMEFIHRLFCGAIARGPSTDHVSMSYWFTPPLYSRFSSPIVCHFAEISSVIAKTSAVGGGDAQQIPIPRVQNSPKSLGMEFLRGTYAHTSYWIHVQKFTLCRVYALPNQHLQYLTVHHIYLNIEFCCFYNRCSVRCRFWTFHFITFRCSAIHSEVTSSPRGFIIIFFL